MNPFTNYLMFETNQGTYAVLPALVQRIAYDAAYYKHLSDTDNIETHHENLGLGMPDNIRVKFDFEGAHQAARLASSEMLGKLIGKVLDQYTARMSLEHNNFEALRDELFELEIRARDGQNKIRAAQRGATDAFMNKVHRRVWWGQVGVGGARFVRNVAAETFLVGAFFLPGAGAIAGLAIGSVGQGYFKYQDTEDVPAAMMQGATTFMVNIVPIASRGGVQRWGRTQYYTMVFATKPLEAGARYANALVEGKSAFEAAIAAGSAMVGGAIGSGLARRLTPVELEKISSGLAKLGTPLNIKTVVKMVGMSGIKYKANQLAGEVGNRLIQRIRQAGDHQQERPKLPVGDRVLADLAIRGPNQSTLPTRVFAPLT